MQKVRKHFAPRKSVLAQCWTEKARLAETAWVKLVKQLPLTVGIIEPFADDDYALFTLRYCITLL